MITYKKERIKNKKQICQCELNPIELIWAQLKVKNLGLKSIHAAAWKKCCEHVVKLEDFYRETEHIIDDIEPVIIHLDSEDSEESDESEDEDDT